MINTLNNSMVTYISTSSSKFDVDFISDSSFIKNFYVNEVYQLNEINAILKILDSHIETFMVVKKYTAFSNSIEYLLVINNVLTISIDINTPYILTDNKFVVDNKPIYYYDLMPKAMEIIKTKYIEYISRLEDSIGKPIQEILTIG